MTTYPEPNSSQVAVYPGGRPFWLGQLGHVTGLTYSSLYPGGPDAATCLLQVPPDFESQALSVGSAARIFRGGTQVWSGALTKPVPGPGGLAITLAGDGNRGADFRYTYTSAWPTSQPDEGVNNAVGRGLPWVNAGLGQPSGIWLGDQPDSGAKSVQDVLVAMASKGGLGWYAAPQPSAALGAIITLAPLPAVPTRILVCTAPVPRTDGGDIRAIFVRYQVTADAADSSTAATYALTSVTNTGHSGAEIFMDLSSSGVMTAAAAQAVASKVLQQYQRFSFAGSFDVTPGNLLTMGGVPVDPGCERAGFMCNVVQTNFDFGGEVSPLNDVSFIAAAFKWDDQARVGSVTPLQTFSQSLSDVIAAVTPAAPAVAS